MNQIADIKPDASSRRSPYFSEEHEMLRAQVRRFVETEIKPHALAWEEQGCVPREVLRRMGSLGFFGIRYPARYGGSEMDALATVVLAEELGRSTFSGVAITALVHSDMASIHVFRSGSEAQKDKWMPAIIAGEVITAVAVTEPDAGSDVKGIRAFARREGDSYILNGAKMFITNGTVADVYVVMAVTDAAKNRSGVSAFIVERGTPGLSNGRRIEKLGLRASDTAEVIFDNVTVPARNLIGELGEGYSQTLKVLEGGRIGIAGFAAGIARGAFEEATAYAKERKQFGKRIADFQAIQWMLADMATRIDASWVLMCRAAELKDKGKPFGREAAMAKLFASETAMWTTIKAVQIHGGYGYMAEFPVERFMRDAKLAEIGEGTSEVQRMIIAKSLLRDGYLPA